MQDRYRIALAVAAAFSLALPARAAAQKTHPGRPQHPSHVEKEHGRGAIVARPHGGAPAFCRSGAGHPVYGREWCVEKGFGLGGSYRWSRADWGAVTLRRRYQPGTVIAQPTLAQVLGTVILGRLAERARTVGAASPLTGRWLATPDGGAVLSVRAAGIPLAELVDTNGDGHANLILLNLGR